MAACRDAEFAGRVYIEPHRRSRDTGIHIVYIFLDQAVWENGFSIIRTGRYPHKFTITCLK